jgi:transketolase C-terminal domain/subunit
MSIKNQALITLGGMIWNALKADEQLQQEAIQFFIDRIPTVKDTATVEEVLVAIKEDTEAIEATSALFKGPEAPDTDV